MVEIEVVSENLTAPQPRSSQNQTRQEKTQLAALYRHLGAPRRATYEKAQQAAPFLTPTLLKRQEEACTEAGDRLTRQSTAQTPGAGRRRSGAPIFAKLAVWR